MERQEGALPKPDDPAYAKRVYLDLLRVYIPNAEGTGLGKSPFPMVLAAYDAGSLSGADAGSSASATPSAAPGLSGGEGE
ncbi:hypothetical protein [Cohnella fermenti]|uniref:Uncharacterized protein n=1 Tax=Cohnella fermenti TaxID=2565925 RepID=A0A4S4C6F3_9BACL|nr:hypothetical protein [Cohnella fermenti]THF83480.1 hypothetical protein E6C55_04785 [Cohnella fermenti]